MAYGFDERSFQTNKQVATVIMSKEVQVIFLEASVIFQ